MKKALQQRSTLLQANAAARSGTSGGTYRCVSPAALAAPPELLGDSRPLLSTEELATLDAARLVVADGVVPPELIRGAVDEFRFLLGHGMLQSDGDDVCNPLQRSMDVPLWSGRLMALLARDCPHLAQLVVRLFTLPQLLETALGLELRVPQTMMLAAYPPGAHYRRHFDSYGGRDIPRFVTCLLYVGWEPAVGGQLRAYTPSEGVRDIEPCPGRLCVFFSQEIEHEVLKSVGDRYAITLWIWSTAKDDQGR